MRQGRRPVAGEPRHLRRAVGRQEVVLVLLGIVEVILQQLFDDLDVVLREERLGPTTGPGWKACRLSQTVEPKSCPVGKCQSKDVQHHRGVGMSAGPRRAEETGRRRKVGVDIDLQHVGAARRASACPHGRSRARRASGKRSGPPPPPDPDPPAKGRPGRRRACRCIRASASATFRRRSRSSAADRR